MTENVLSLKPWDAALRRAKTKTTGLLERSDLASYVPSLSPLEAYTAVKELGPSDAPGVLVHFSPEQIQTLWDLEGWHVHRLSVPDVVLWLSSFREGSLEAMQRAAANMDFEALSVLLRRRLLIASKPRDDRSDDDPLPEWLSHPSPDIEPLVETPDGRFIIAARPFDEDESIDEDVDEEDRKWVLSFVAELYQQEDWESVATVLRSALNDLTTSLEEDAYRFRSGRLEDLGFPPRERAIEIYGLLDPGPASPLAPAPVVDLPLIAPFVEPLQQGFFHAAMQSITDPAQMRRLEGDLVAVANKALVADGIAPSQTESVQEALRRLRGYIELALVEGVAPSERLPEATRRLLEDHLERLFRIGYTLTVRAGGRARRLLERPELGDGSRDLALRRLSTAEQGVVEALLLRRPRVSGALEPVVLAQQTIERSTGDEAVTFALDAGAAEIRRPFFGARGSRRRPLGAQRPGELFGCLARIAARASRPGRRPQSSAGGTHAGCRPRHRGGGGRVGAAIRGDRIDRDGSRRPRRRSHADALRTGLSIRSTPASRRGRRRASGGPAGRTGAVDIGRAAVAPCG